MFLASSRLGVSARHARLPARCSRAGEPAAHAARRERSMGRTRAVSVLSADERRPERASGADVPAVPADAAGRPGRRRDRQPPAARAGRVHPQGRLGHLLLAAAREPGAAQGRADRARGDGPGRRPGDHPADHPAARALGAQRSRRRVRPDDVPAAGPQGDAVLSRADGRGSGHHAGGGRVLVVPRPAGEPLPDQLEVPRRAAPALRRCCAPASS